MAVEIFCPKCHTNYFVSQSHLGKKVRCARCKVKFIAADMTSKTQSLQSMVHASEETVFGGKACFNCGESLAKNAAACAACGAEVAK